VRFMTIRDVTSLPVRQLRRQFRNEEVHSVLPARAAVNGTESLLIATTSALAIVTAAPGTPRWVTRWAPWDSVHTTDDVSSRGSSNDSWHHLSVQVDRLRFDSALPGRMGLRAMHDFIAVACERRSHLPTRP
jgi:hypothetical protein